MTAKQNILLLTLILLGGFFVLTANAQSTISSVKSIEISPTQIITSVTCSACVGGVPTGQKDSNGCSIYSCPADKKCSSAADCGDVKKCPDGTTYREKVCKNNVCEQVSFTGGTPCFNETVECSSSADCGDVKKCLDGTTYRERVCKNNVCEQVSFTGGTPCFNETKQCPVGCTCYGDTTTCPVEGIKPIEAKISSLESGVKSVSIEKVPNGLSLQSEKATAITTEKLVIEENKLSLKTSTGNKEIKILPEEASSRATAVTSVDTIELKEESQQLIYFIKGMKQAKLLFVIPISMQIETKVSAESGNVISVKKPWWSFLAR